MVVQDVCCECPTCERAHPAALPPPVFSMRTVPYGPFRRKRIEVLRNGCTMLSVERWGALSRYWFVVAYRSEFDSFDGIFLKGKVNVDEFVDKFIKSQGGVA